MESTAVPPPPPSTTLEDAEDVEAVEAANTAGAPASTSTMSANARQDVTGTERTVAAPPDSAVTRETSSRGPDLSPGKEEATKPSLCLMHY